MIKRIIILLLLAMGYSSYSQQVMLLNQYQVDPFSINPAFAGQTNQVYVNLNYRKQWAGFTNAPAVYYLNAHSLLGEKPPKSYEPMSIRIADPSKYESLYKRKSKKIRQGIGANIQNENFGQIRRFSTGITYALHMQIGKKYNLSGGITAGLLTYNFSSDNLTLIEANDQTFQDFVGQNLSNSFLNINAGLLFYADNFYIGYSANQIYKNQIWFVSNSSAIELKTHHILHAQYHILSNGPYSFKPGFLMRYTADVPLSFDLSTSVDYNNKYWGGIIYRFNSAIALFGGMNYRNMRFAYSFDLNTNALINYNSGSHEILMGLVF